jgi:YjbE family integral membrane protein
MDLTTGSFWFALGSIILTNILLSGDNAVVIALASRTLPKAQQKVAMIWGSVAAIVILVCFTYLAVTLLKIQFIKMFGAALLIYVGVKLMSEGDDEPDTDSQASLWAAIKTILIANLVMSLDNVIAVAAAAQKAPENARLFLLCLGLGVSVPVIIFGSAVLIKLMERFPAIIVMGAGLLGMLAGDMFIEEPFIHNFLQSNFGEVGEFFQVAGVVIVIGLGLFLKKKNQKKLEQA